MRSVPCPVQGKNTPSHPVLFKTGSCSSGAGPPCTMLIIFRLISSLRRTDLNIIIPHLFQICKNCVNPPSASAIATTSFHSDQADSTNTQNTIYENFPTIERFPPPTLYFIVKPQSYLNRRSEGTRTSCLLSRTTAPLKVSVSNAYSNLILLSAVSNSRFALGSNFNELYLHLVFHFVNLKHPFFVLFP